MKNTEREPAPITDPQQDWQQAITNEDYYFMKPDPEDEDEEEEDEDAGDWGHIDPAEGNSPFPDSNDPSGPGSAV